MRKNVDDQYSAYPSMRIQLRLRNYITQRGIFAVYLLGLFLRNNMSLFYLHISELAPHHSPHKNNLN